MTGSPRNQDRAIEAEEEDALERGPFVESLIRTLVSDIRDDQGRLAGRRSTGFVVGLTGKWGLGKSSILNLLSLRLRSMSEVIVAVFNPWLFSGRDELVRGFFSELRGAMGRSTTEHARELATALDRYWGAVDLAGHAIAGYADLHGAGGTATVWWKDWGTRLKGAIPKPNDRSPEQERKALEAKLAKNKIAVVVLIDELDRVEDAEVRAVAQLVKAVGDIKGLSYLVAYDPERVVDALGRGDGAARAASGASYLEKIIQHPIPLRPLFGEDVEALLKAALVEYGHDLPSTPSKNEELIWAHIKAEISTPREVKRLVSSFSVLEAAVRGEVSAIDVLAYSWILTKAPAVRDAIAAELDKVVDDPSEEEMIARILGRDRDKNRIPTPVEILGDRVASMSTLLALLFPRFSDDQRENESGVRLFRRRNLVRLLYLGNPPGMIARAKIEALWNRPDAASMEAGLRSYQEEQVLPPLLDRLDDLLPSLESGNDAQFWPALSRTLTRKKDWMSGPEVEHAVSNDAATSLMRVGIRDESEKPRVKAAVETLIETGDLVLVPKVLRQHMFAHGLTKHGPARGGQTIYSKDETEKLMARELPRYRAAVLEGTALRRLPNVEAIYAIANTGAWDSELRSAFTAQLRDRESLSTLAALLVPPGHSADRKALGELFDPDVVFAQLNALEPVDPASETWIDNSRNRLRAILARHALDDRSSGVDSGDDTAGDEA